MFNNNYEKNDEKSYSVLTIVVIFASLKDTNRNKIDHELLQKK